MGRAGSDDRPEALRAETTLGQLDAARHEVDAALEELSAHPGASLAPLQDAWSTATAVWAGLQHDASAHACAGTLAARREGTRRLESLRTQLEHSSALSRVLQAGAPASSRERVPSEGIRRARRRAGSDASPRQRDIIARSRQELEQLCEAFAQHHGHHAEQSLRETWRTARAPSQRAAAWQALHERGRAREVLVRDILRLRGTWAQAAGYESFASMQTDAGAFDTPESIQRWLDRGLARLRTLPREDILRTAVVTGEGEQPTVSRDATALALKAVLERYNTSAKTVALDLAPRASKHPGSWTSAFVNMHGRRCVVVCASLPARLDRTHIRALLHEAGHAAEQLCGVPPPPPLCERDHEHLEVASIWFERAALDPTALRELGAESLAPPRPQRSNRRDLLLQMALAYTDVAVHHAFVPSRDGSPLAWARRVLQDAEGRPRDPSDSTIAMHSHLFSHPRGYAGRYAAYAFAESAVDHLAAAHGPGLPTPAKLAEAIATLHRRRHWRDLLATPPGCDAIVDAGADGR